MAIIRSHSHGFTLVEVVVAAALLMLYAMAASSAITATASLLQQGKVRNEALQTVQFNTEQIRQAALSFCRQPNSSDYGPVIDPENINSSLAKPCPGYASAYVSNFKNACDRHTSRALQIGQLFLNYLSDPSNHRIKDNITNDSGHTYTIKTEATAGNGNLLGSDLSTGRTVKISFFAKTNNFSQSTEVSQIIITPNAAAWCPVQYE